MNINLNTDCFQLSIDAPGSCTKTETPVVEPVKPEVPYTPENKANIYDEAGVVHNEAIQYLRKVRAKKELTNQQVMEAAFKFVNSYKFKSKALQSLEKGNQELVKDTFLKYGIIDGCIPFPWPWLPGGPKPGFPLPFPNSGNHRENIDPIDLIFILFRALRDGRVPIFAKGNIMDWENNVINSDMEENAKAACLMNASIARHTLALTNEGTDSNATVKGKVSPWWAVVADGAGGLLGSLGGGIATIVGAAVASGVADRVIEKANEG